MQDIFLQYGAIGAIALILLIAVREMFKVIQADKSRETERADRNEAKLIETNEMMMERVIPAVLEMVSTTKALTQVIADLQAERRRK